MQSTRNFSKQINKLKEKIKGADAVVIGAGSGLSSAAGLTYSGERFQKHFADYIEKYHFPDMYYATFYPYDTLEEYWAYMSRHIYWNRYAPGDRTVYHNLLKLVQGKDYFILTTNVDHQFQKAGFDKKRLFYTQGDYGLFQCKKPCHEKTYGNEDDIIEMLAKQKSMKIRKEQIPRCPKCGGPMGVNLRCDETFVQDAGWYAAHGRYTDFIRRHEGMHVLYLELGVGNNTPVIIKYPFWQMTAGNPDAVYACINLQDAVSPGEIKGQSICIDTDIGEALNLLVAE